MAVSSPKMQIANDSCRFANNERQFAAVTCRHGGRRAGLVGLILIAVLTAVGTGGAALARPDDAGGTAVCAPCRLRSPDGSLMVEVRLDAQGRPFWRLLRFGEEVIAPSRLGLRLAGEPSLADGLVMHAHATREVDETWQPVWGQWARIRNHYRELVVSLARAGTPERTALTIIFRLFDTGVGFRYHVPAGTAGADAPRIVEDELTEFALAGDHTAWWIGSYLPNRYEYLYRRGPVSAIRGAITPLTMKTATGIYLSIHEAALVDYPEMTLSRETGTTLKADLVPWSDGAKAHLAGGFRTPWRTLIVTDRAVDLIAAAAITLNLNEPSRIADTSWIRPGKYVGVWWEMHIGRSTWATGPRHGATTENVKRYIDFAAAHGFDGVLVEGWNVGWDGDWMANADRFAFTTPAPDTDFDALARYAAEKGVRIIGHHETSGGIENYERQLEDAMAYMAAHGVRVVKTGYVAVNGHIRRHDEMGRERREWQHGQYMVRHMQKVLEVAARHHIAIDTHEPVKDTGLSRTWPNWMTREGARGQEYNAWSAGNPPDHTTILPFTRLLAGPMDFTPGIFKLRFHGPDSPFRVHTTLAKQLALYVVIYSPLQMAADLPENYEARPDAFRFIEDVPTDWRDTRALMGEIGDYLVVARADKRSRDWYLGAITDEHGRRLVVDLGFLESGRRYRADIYRDGEDADWRTNPESLAIEHRIVTSADRLILQLAPGGGTAIRFAALPAKTP